MDDNRYLPRFDHYFLDSFQGLLQVSEISRKCRKMSIIFLIADVFIRELLSHHPISMTEESPAAKSSQSKEPETSDTTASLKGHLGHSRILTTTKT